MYLITEEELKHLHLLAIAIGVTSDVKRIDTIRARKVPDRAAAYTHCKSKFGEMNQGEYVLFNRIYDYINSHLAAPDVNETVCENEPTRFWCNNCAETENGFAPCVFEVPGCMGTPPVTVCPVSGEECGWDEELPSPKKEESPAKSLGKQNAPQCACGAVADIILCSKCLSEAIVFAGQYKSTEGE